MYQDNPREDIAQIPEALRSLDRWMGTRFVHRKDGRIDKPPYRVASGKPIKIADKTDAANWATYDQAAAALEAGDVDAIGFVFTADDPFFVVDLDGVVDRDTGEIRESAAQIIHNMHSYTELSCSGTGVHVVGVGTKPEYAACKSKKLGITVEVYDDARFMVMTGHRIASETEPERRQEQLEWICQRLWMKAERMASRPPTRSVSIDLEDEDLLERARRARTGAKFRRLYDAGDISGYPSHSEADYGLLNMLIFWTAGDPERIERLFERSALYREKGKDRRYLQRSVADALASYVGGFYRPRDIRRKREEQPARPDPLTPYLRLLLDPSAWTGRKSASAYKAFTAAAIIASEHGVVDDDGNLRIGCDTRRLAEVAGMSKTTLLNSALPYLYQELKLLRWNRGKPKHPSSFVLCKPVYSSCTDKDSTHFIGTSSVNNDAALNTLRLLIRMRRGSSRSAYLLRLGMPAMFATIVLAAAQRGQNLDELAQATGRRKDYLKEAIRRLKAAGIVKETAGGAYTLTTEFARHYERALDLSGITYAERNQKRGHDDDRARRDSKLGTDKQERKLRGKEHMQHITNRKIHAAREKWRESERQRAKVGVSVTTFLDAEIDGKYGARIGDTIERWRLLHGGEPQEIFAAIQYGPFKKRRFAGDLYVYHDPR